MKIIEILLEYNQAITARRFGAQIIKLTRQDERFDDIPDDQLINQVLDIIETRDPTPNKEYTQRLVELYVTDNLNIDRINQNRLLEAHWIGKRRGMIRQEHANFNVFKSYDAFEAVMSNPELYDIEAILTKSDDKGKSTKVYEDNQI